MKCGDNGLTGVLATVGGSDSGDLEGRSDVIRSISDHLWELWSVGSDSNHLSEDDWEELSSENIL